MGEITDKIITIMFMFVTVPVCASACKGGFKST